jgi:hypothetical protein
VIEQTSPALFAVGFVSLLACGLATAAFVTALRSSPARQKREHEEMVSSFDTHARRLGTIEADNGALRDEWVKHRVAVTELLDDAVTAMENTERRRRSARAERKRAEDVREGDEQQEPAQYECGQCRYVHMRGEDCMACARRRFAM